MVNLIRRFQQPLMIAITVLVIIAFAWLYNTRTVDHGGSDQVGQIYGRKVNQAEFIRAAKKFDLARDLMMSDLLMALIPREMGMSLDSATEGYVWSSMVLKHEADAMGIVVTDAEVQEFIKNMPVFQNNGRYDASRYVNFVQNALSYRGLTEDQVHELVRENLKLRRLKELIGSTSAAAPSEVRALFDLRNQTTEASVIRLKLEDFVKSVTLTEEDLKKAFEERKSSLNAPEKRKVKFVSFALSDADKALGPKERVAKMEPLAEKAGDFAVAMTEKGATFEQVAEKFMVPVQTSPEFTQEEPPKELGNSPEAAQAAFRLTKEEPNSDAIRGREGYYVMQLVDVVPARPLAFEEAKPKLEEQLKDERGREAMALKATEIRNKISEELKAGKSFADAAKAAGATPETFPPFSLAEPKMDQPDAQEVMSATIELQPGQMSEPLPTGTGTLLVHVDKKLPADDAKYEKEKQMLTQSIERNHREALFQEWMKDRREEAGILTGRKA